MFRRNGVTLEGKKIEHEQFAEQVAALPLRWNDKGRLRVPTETSRCTGRWVVPKGRTMQGKKLWCAAEIDGIESPIVDRAAPTPVFLPVTVEMT